MLAGHLNLREIPRMGQVSTSFRCWIDSGSSVMWKNGLEAALCGDIDNFAMSAVKFMCNASPEKLREMLGSVWCRVTEVADSQQGGCLNAVARWGSPEVAAALLDAAGSDAARISLLSWRNDKGWNCLHCAALWGSPETTKTLVQATDAAGVLVQLLEDRDNEFAICLYNTAGWGSPDTMAVLLDAAASAGVLDRLLKMHD